MAFASQVKKWSEQTKKDSRKIVTEIFISLSTRILERTPIGDKTSWQNPAPVTYEPGTLRNSWTAGIGNTLSGLKVRTPNTSGADARNNIRAVAKLVPGNIAFLANPAPYANRIEYTGWSGQAPAGMVRITLREFKQIVKGAVNVSS